MQYQCAVQGYRRRRDTNAYYAAMYLLTSNDDIYRRTANCFCKDGIEFGYPLKGKAFCGCCGHALSRTMQKTSYYYCRHSEADVESHCHKMRLNAAELEQAVFLTLKKQMEATAPLAPDGSLRVDASVPERVKYEQQIEALQDGKRTLYER